MLKTVKMTGVKVYMNSDGYKHLVLVARFLGFNLNFVIPFRIASQPKPGLSISKELSSLKQGYT